MRLSKIRANVDSEIKFKAIIWGHNVLKVKAISNCDINNKHEIESQRIQWIYT